MTICTISIINTNSINSKVIGYVASEVTTTIEGTISMRSSTSDVGGTTKMLLGHHAFSSIDWISGQLEVSSLRPLVQGEVVRLLRHMLIYNNSFVTPKDYLSRLGGTPEGVMWTNDGEHHWG